ncbi:MAG: M48 family metalloprotease [Alphaproteobacteria bacterium]|nr:M48 family metalloprotease [Alphaproteobacteria bacterium]
MPGRLACMVLALALAGCSNLGHLGTTTEPQVASTAEAAPSHEHERILAAYGGVYHDPRLQALISDTVAKLVAASDRPDLSYRVTILNSGAVNAFALPSGQLYVTRGLIALACDTSELASVLSHEMAHVLRHHAADREDQARQAAIVNQVLNDMGNDPELAALALAKTRLNMASFSRAQEFEADAVGVALSERAHFDPYGAARLLTGMQRNAELNSNRSLDPRAQDFTSSHPATPERVRNAQSSARQHGAPENFTRDRDNYLSAIDNIVYGDDPSEGFVRGRRFLHPRLGFTFQVPGGFMLDTTTAPAVIGVRDGGQQAMRFDMVAVPAEQKLADYLNSGWMEGIDKATTEDLTIAGYPAASALARGEQWQFRIYVLRYNSDVFRFIFASRQKNAESERNIRDTINSFRRLSLEEIQSARPLRIRIVTVQPGDTVESLSRRSGSIDHPVERFRILNQLDARARVRPNDRVKIIVD